MHLTPAYTIAAALAIGLGLASVSQAAEPDQITRRLGLEMLRQKMIDHQKAIDWTPPGYFLVGYTVRVG